MKFQQLLRQSHLHILRHCCPTPQPIVAQLFPDGAKWMFERLQELRHDRSNSFPSRTHYNWYGIMKYSISLFGFVGSMLIISWLHFLLLPFAVLFFYLFEVHLLFLFPLLVDSAKQPIPESIRLTYQIGLLRVLITVLPIGMFMIAGIFNFKKPWRNWYIGSLAIIIWYHHEVGNRLSASV